MSHPFNIIVATDIKGGIAREGKIPWSTTTEGRHDLRWFRLATTINKNTDGRDIVIMGRKTWESMGGKPLTNRINIVLSRLVTNQETFGMLTDAPVVRLGNLNAALTWCKHFLADKGPSAVWVMGGEQLYAEAVVHPMAHKIYLTEFADDFQCDQFMTLPMTEPGMGVWGSSGYNHDWRLEKAEVHNFADNHTCDISIERYIVKSNGYWPAAGQRCDVPMVPHYRAAHKYCIKVYTRQNESEDSYKRLLNILTKSPIRPNRTGTDTRSLFVRSLRFPLSVTLKRGSTTVYHNVSPTLTTKRVAHKTMTHELIWILRGSDTTDYLVANGVTIWNGNSTRDYLDSRGLTHYREGQLGPVYGYQWRRWGKKYDSENNNSGADVVHDQVLKVIYGLLNDPWDRRHLITALNVSDLDKMSLPPCHFVCQFYVDVDPLTPSQRRLSCHVNMRSADMFLGVPFNIASYGLLTHMIAAICGYRAHELILTMGDCHLYINHVEQALTQCSRGVRGYPAVKFSDNAQEMFEAFRELVLDGRANSDHLDYLVENFNVDDVELINYYPHGVLKGVMAV